MSKTKILIAIDDPDWAKILVRTAYNLIDRENSEITLLNVIETTVAEEYYFYAEPDKFIHHEADKAGFAELENFLENSEADYKGFIYKEGNAADIILKTLKEGGYDLAVIGSHNKNPIERLLLGSVAYKVSHRAKNSVLIINSSYKPGIDAESSFSILMGVDMTDDAVFEAENIHRFIDRKRAEVNLLHVTTEPSLIIPPDAYIYIDIAAIIRETNKAAEDLLNRIESVLETQGLKVKRKCYVQGDAASEIIDTAKKKQADLVVVGSHSNKKEPKWLMGSVSTKVYEHANKPVLIIK